MLTHCENCGAHLSGAYCSQCGQHAIDYRRSLWRVLIDAADSFLNWDTKFLSTLGVLLTRPWKLTNDFNAGRRARYVHPLRLYLLASVAFFLMTRMVHLGDQIRLRPEDRAEISAALGTLTTPETGLAPEQQAKIDSIRKRIAQADGAISAQERADLKNIIRDTINAKMKDTTRSAERARLKAALAMIPRAPAPESAPVPSVVPPEVPPRKPIDIHIGDEKKPKSGFEVWLQNKVKDKIGPGGVNSKLFFETLRNNIPTMMLGCIPLFAFVLKILYIGKGRFYVEHLVYALHIHSFVYLAVLLITLLGLALAPWSENVRPIIDTLLGGVVAAQVLLSIRRVYRQGWFMSLLKFFAGGLVYFIILICAVGITALITILLP